MSVCKVDVRRAGFTLVELLIAVVVLGVLAMIVVPSLGASSEDSKAQSLKANLAELRSAIEFYRVQHGDRYPGQYSEADGTTQTTAAPLAAGALVAQLLQYSDVRGKVSTTPGPVFKYGPYLKSGAMLANPFLSGAAANAVLVDLSSVDSTTAPHASGTSGWKFYLKTGRLVANDNLTLSDASTRTVNF